MRRRKWWGWGYEDERLPESFLARIAPLLQAGLGVTALEPRYAPRLDRIRLRAPRVPLPDRVAVWCTDDTAERAGHCYGKSYRDVIRAIRGELDNPPDYVAYPRDESDIVELMTHCEAQRIAVVPYGGGSSVVGGVEPTTSERYRGVITVDLRRLDRVLQVDRTSQSARVQAGIFGPALEAGLKPHGLTLRHQPQSWEFSTLGGWIATRSAGHFPTIQTHIDDFVESVRLVTPRGPLETMRVPYSGAGPNPDRLVLGSEGVLGIITEAWIRVQAIATFRASATVLFREVAEGIQAVRAISQSGLFPSSCRLISPFEALTMGLGGGDGAQTALMLAFESHDHPVEAPLTRGLELCAQANGRWDAGRVAAGTGADQWRAAFLQAPYLRDHLALCGLVVETFETAVTWDRFEALHRAVLAVAESAIAAECGKGFVFWRLTHAYPDGPAAYYTVVALGRKDDEVAQWTKIKAAVSDAIVAGGGTITHHHAVGRDHRPWFAGERGALFTSVLASAKRTVDPGWILNPGVLIPLEDGERAATPPERR